MKSAIYIADGRVQVVLTGENDWEKAVLAAIEKGEGQLSVKRGRFYNCQGGWTAQGDVNFGSPTRPAPPESVMLIVDRVSESS